MAKKKEMAEQGPGFEDLLAETEELAGKMEQGGLTLDESLQAYEKGVANLRLCADLLRSAEEKVKVLLEKDGVFALEDLDEDGDDGVAEDDY